MPKYSRRQPSRARRTSAARVRSPTATSAPAARRAAARSSSRWTSARTGRPRRRSAATTAPPTPPTRPAAPVTRIGWTVDMGTPSRTPRSGWLSDLLPRSARSLNRLGDQLLQLSVEHGGNFRHLRVAELPEQRGRPVVLHAGLSFLVLVEQHAQWGIKPGPDVVPRHLEGEQRVADDVLDRPALLPGQAQ